MDYVCPQCHVAVMLQHPEAKFSNLGWYKCPFCGFCRREGTNERIQLKEADQRINEIDVYQGPKD